MSKITELRRQATDAVRARRWDKAVELYERVCELDSGNASYRNELGDVYLKMGDVGMAVTAFVAAADLYNGVGLTNNAIAVHKKILRHDPNHLDSIWGLGEIRFEQGLEADATMAFMDFLHRADGLPEELRSPYEARCFELLERMQGDPQVLSGLESVFEHWDLEEGHAQVLIAKALLALEAGEDDMAEKYVERARSVCATIDAMPAWKAYVERTAEAFMDSEPSGPVKIMTPEELSRPVAPVQAEPLNPEPTALAEPASPAPPEPTVLPADPVEPAVPADASAPVAPELPVHADGPESGETPTLEIDESDLDLGFDFNAASPPPDTDGAEDPASAPGPEPANSGAGDAGAPADVDGGIDLLEQLLADGDLDIQGEERRQIDTIAQEMEGQIAGSVDADDYAGQYEIGVVYMDMGLFDQAIAAFDRAKAGEEQQLKAVEMKGTCLLKLNRSQEAMAVFQEGLAVPGYPARYYLGLLYGVGSCHEAAGELLEAIDYFERVAAVDERFQDVSSRLASLQQLIADDA